MQRGFAPIVVVIVLVLIGIMGFYFISSKPTKVNPESTSSNLPITNKASLLAYSEGHRALPDGGVLGGDLWTIDPENLQKHRVATNSNIAWVHDWSPSGEYIAVVVNEKKDSIISTIAVVEVKTGNIIRLKEVGSGVRGQLFWSSDNEVVYLRSDTPNDTTLSAISINDKTESDLIILPKELTGDPKFSSDKKWVAAGDSPFKTGKIYSYKVETKLKKALTDVQAQFGGWISNKVIYATQDEKDNGIWEINADGSNKRKLVDLGEMKTAYLTTSGNGSKVVYVATNVVNGQTNQKLYSYDYNSGVISKAYVEVNTPDGISGVEVSKNGKYVSYYLSSKGIKIVNLQSGEINDICNDVYCDSNWSEN